MTDTGSPRWICAQVGSRENYAIPRVLHAGGRLDTLLTDYWSEGGSVATTGPAARLAQRFHPELADARIEHLGFSRIAFDLGSRIVRRNLWTTVLKRNDWFQRSMLRRLRSRNQNDLRESPGIFFSYSYAALELARFFRELGWKIILGQIDPGVREEQIVAAERKRHPEVKSNWTPAPDNYWSRWKEECTLVDRIIVNSQWSREALIEAGISNDKIRIVPLAHDQPANPPPANDYPDAFTDERPLRVLFLGQILLRKGAHLIFEAARKLINSPIEWQFVGPSELSLPADLAESARIKWSGAVSRAETEEMYRSADVFLLPTLSDGFALTQLEAQATRLPILASRFCGAVVENGVNGLLIDPPSTSRIVATVRYCLEHPSELASFSVNSGISRAFSFDVLSENLLSIQSELLSS